MLSFFKAPECFLFTLAILEYVITLSLFLKCVFAILEYVISLFLCSFESCVRVRFLILICNNFTDSAISFCFILLLIHIYFFVI